MDTSWKNSPCNIVVLGDVYVSGDTMEEALRTQSGINIEKVTKLFWGPHDKEEYSEWRMGVERNGPEGKPSAEGIEEAVKDAHVIMTHYSPITASTIEKAKNLKLIVICRGGYENIDVAAATKRGIPVINVIRNAEAVVDLTMGLIYSVIRNISYADAQIKAGNWTTKFKNSESLMCLSSMVVGLVGIGNIGKMMAERLHAQGVKVIAFDAYTSREAMDKMGLEWVEKIETMEELFETADLISMHLRLTKENEHSIDKRYFERMKPTAYFINAARGGLINQKDLTDALESGKIMGAGLDTFEVEPIGSDDPLTKLDNVVLTPHIGGMTVDSIERSPFFTMKGVSDFLEKDITGRVVNYKDIS